MLILFHEATGQLSCNYYRTLNPFDKAGLAVDWAGESESKNWMHIAREYSEKWLHQEQIRDAVGKPGLMTRELFYPFIDIVMLALPHTYRAVEADDGTIVQLTATTELGGSWFLERRDHTWKLQKNILSSPAVELRIDPATAWKLFSKSMTPEQAIGTVTLTGDRQLGEIALSMVSVIA